MDNVTQLPISQELLAFYRNRLKQKISDVEHRIEERLTALQSDAQHVHLLEFSLDKSTQVIRALETENMELKEVLKELIEDNARLRLKQRPTMQPLDMDRLLILLQKPLPRYDDRQLITNINEKTQYLAETLADSVSDLAAERRVRETIEVKLMEMEEALRVNLAELQCCLQINSRQPSIEDFEFLRMERQRLQHELDLDAEEMSLLRKQNDELEVLARSGGYIADATPPHAPFSKTDRFDEETIRGPSFSKHEIVDSIEYMMQKLQSLEKFALKHFPLEGRGIKEFFETVEKSRARVNDIERRLRERR